MRLILKLLVVSLLAVLCYAIVVERRVTEQFQGNRSGLLLLSRARVEANPWVTPDLKQELVLLDNAGYDGQFMYAIAFDPLALRFRDQPKAYQPFLDAPPYRYGRVGFPALTSIVAAGHPERFPVWMIALLYAGVFLAALATGWLARREGFSAWWALAITLVPGFWMSFQHALPEPLAAGAAIAGFACVRSRRIVAGALLLAAACLIRETAVVFVLCIAGSLMWSQRRSDALKLLGLALVPLLLWRLYIGVVFAPGWGFEAFWSAPDNFGLPFRGIIALWSDLSAGRYYPGLWEMRRGILCFSILVIAAAGLSWKMFRDRPGAVTATAAIFGVMSICFNLSGVWVETAAAERLTSDLFVLLALATPEFINKSKTWRWILAAFWLLVVAYLLFGTLDAAFNREAFLKFRPKSWF